MDKFESMLFQTEMVKYHKSGYKWKNYEKQLFAENKYVYNYNDIKIIKRLLYSHLPSQFRGKFWLIASGAKRQKANNPGYYKSLLKNYPRKTKNNGDFPYLESIELDLHRTFPENKFFRDEVVINKMRNVLLAFAFRNLTIGYCQGFNYIVGKLIQVLDDEEDTFWVFTEIAENYLPFDFYIKFTGVRTDTEIIKKIIKHTIPGIEMNAELCISNLITKCFISLFSQSVNDTILFAIWDAFFIYGNITLYRGFIWAIYLLYNKNAKYKDIEDIHNELTNKLNAVTDVNSLNYFLMMYNRFDENYIQFYRNKWTDTTIGKNYINTDESLKIAKTCDVNSPFCLCNKEGEIVKNYNEFYCLREKNINFIDDYFNMDKFKNYSYIITKEKPKDENDSIEDLMIERQKHFCSELIEKANLAEGITKNGKEQNESIENDNEFNKNSKGDIVKNIEYNKENFGDSNEKLENNKENIKNNKENIENIKENINNNNANLESNINQEITINDQDKQENNNLNDEIKNKEDINNNNVNLESNINQEITINDQDKQENNNLNDEIKKNENIDKIKEEAENADKNKVEIKEELNKEQNLKEEDYQNMNKNTDNNINKEVNSNDENENKPTNNNTETI